MIWTELNEALITVNLDVNSQEEALTVLGNTLIKQGYCKNSYVDALIEREKNYATGLNTGSIGVAIPHTDATQVNESAIAVATLTRPVDWVELGTDDDHLDVSLIFMLAICGDPNAHLDVLSELTHIFQDKETMNKIMEAKSPAEVIDVIKNCPAEIMEAIKNSETK